ncbi:MAG TPA: hypothetical protein VLS93_06895 [Anaeromyxobacteraceae bacterium]|nr:hypothetical protein [Anaeromyxobacteraceae bacterium]
MNPHGRIGLLGALLALAGCPLPQPVAQYPDTGTIPSPRIKIADVTPIETFIDVDPTVCVDPIFTLSASLVDDNTTEAVDARWFVDYDPADGFRQRPVAEERIEPPPPGTPDPRLRAVAALPFQAYLFAPHDEGVVRVVELVVSNSFAAEPVPAPPGWLAYRTPTPDFETQLFRWVFRYRAGGACAYP